MNRKIGTKDIEGAVVVTVDYNQVHLEKDGKKFVLELEYEQDYNSFCDGGCSCCYSNGSGAYLVAEEIVE